LAKITISALTAAFASTTALNAKFQQIEDALNDLVLYRDNTGTPGEPNSMAQDLDMGSNQIVNLVNPTNDQDACTKVYADDLVTSAETLGGLTADQFLRSDADDTTTGDLTIGKASPAFALDDDGSNNALIFFKDGGTNRGLLFWNRSTDTMTLRQYDTDGTTVVGQVELSEVGDINLAGQLQINGSDVTATAAELNYNDITTLGTGAVSKAVVLDGAGDYTYPTQATMVFPSAATETFEAGSLLTVAGTETVSGTLNVTGALQIDGTSVLATAVELNNVDADTAATATTVVDADRVVMNDDDGPMKQVAMTDLGAYFNTDVATLGTTEPNKVVTADGAGDVHITDDLVIDNANPVIRFVETDASANNGAWRLFAQGEGFTMGVTSDSPYSSQTNFLSVQRTANNVDSVSLIGDEIILVGDTNLAGNGDFSTHNAVDEGLTLAGTLVTTTALEINDLDQSANALTTITPTIYGQTTAGTPTYSAQTGWYYQVGHIVHFRAFVAISAIGGMVGDLRIVVTGAPNLSGAAGSPSPCFADTSSNLTLGTNEAIHGGAVASGGSGPEVEISLSDNSNTTQRLQGADIPATFSITVQGSYYA